MPTHMKAAVLKNFNELVVQDVPVPRMDADSLLVKVHACSICGSDLRTFRSGNKRVRFPAIIGHEMSGEVIEVGGNVTGYQKGDRLAVGADIPCGQCDWCRDGIGNMCLENHALGYQFPGGFAEYCALPAMIVQNGPLGKIPEHIEMEHAALAEPLACCLNGFERVQFKKGQSVLIIGAGSIGIFLLQTAKALGASKVIIADEIEARLELARAFKPDETVNSAAEDLKARVMTFTGNKGVDIIFTACSVPHVQEQAVGLVARHGFINFFGGLAQGQDEIRIPSNILHYGECYITGSHGSAVRHHARALDLIISGQVNVAPLITHRFALADIGEAFAVAQARQGLKVMVKP